MPVRPPVCLSVRAPNSKRKKNIEKKQNLRERFPKMKERCANFLVQKVEGRGVIERQNPSESDAHVVLMFT